MTIDIYSKVHFEDIDEISGILAYLDFDQILDEKWILKYMDDLVNLNPILKQAFVNISDNISLKTVDNFDINQQYDIKYTKHKNFDKYISSLLNDKFKMETKWFVLWCIDKKTNKSRWYVKMHHSYADGYKLIQMLLQPIYNNTVDITKQFKRKKNIFESMYYYFIGTIILFIITIKNLMNLMINNHGKNSNDDKDGKNDKTDCDYIICKKLKFAKIKEYTKKNNITINDFLYLLMIKADKLYFKRNKDLQIFTQVNISGINNLNNICPVINVINNSQYINILSKQIHETFNHLKYSLFVPLLNYILNIVGSINIEILSFLHNIVTNDCDYAFSNVIGPQFNEFKDMKITDIHFFSKSKNNIIIYNIISSGDNINITCTFEEGRIKNKKKFKKCIYKVYSDLVLNDGINDKNDSNVNDMV
jgi:hypothetical protein